MKTEPFAGVAFCANRRPFLCSAAIGAAFLLAGCEISHSETHHESEVNNGGSYSIRNGGSGSVIISPGKDGGPDDITFSKGSSYSETTTTKKGVTRKTITIINRDGSKSTITTSGDVKISLPGLTPKGERP